MPCVDSGSQCKRTQPARHRSPSCLDFSMANAITAAALRAAQMQTTQVLETLWPA